MTNQNNTAQPVLTDDEILTATLYGQSEARMIRNGRAIEQAVLSKLRAPVADERALPPLPAAWGSAINDAGDGHVDLYSAEQMQEYARAHAGAVRSVLASAAAIDAGELPPLPEPAIEGSVLSPQHKIAYSAPVHFTADQMRDYARAALASAHVAPQACPTDVCQAGQQDGVLCANDECDRASGVRPASAPVAGDGKTRVPGDQLGGPAVAWDDGAQSDPNRPESRASIESKGGAIAPADGEAQPVAWANEDGDPISDALKQARPDLYGKHYTRPLVYAAPQASEADIATILAFIFERFGQPCDAGELPDSVVSAVRRLERRIPARGENIRTGAPYDDPAFEALCREHGIWGTAEAALCAVFWRQAGQQRAAGDERTAFEATYQADYDDPGAACEREHFGKGYRAGLAAQSVADKLERDYAAGKWPPPPGTYEVERTVNLARPKQHNDGGAE